MRGRDRGAKRPRRIPTFISSHLDPIRWARRRMDTLALAVQDRPTLGRVVHRVRRVMIWFIRPVLPRPMERREVAQARNVMESPPPQPTSGMKVLIMSFRAWTSHVAWETTIAQSLRLRGARCEFFFCGGGLPICEIGWAAAENGKPCEFCAPYVGGMLEVADFPRHALDSLVPRPEREAIIADVRRRASADPAAIASAGITLLPLVEQSLLWFFRSGMLPDTDEVRRARADFLAGAAVVAEAATRLLDVVRPDAIVMVNGQFFEERVVREVARRRDIRIISYEAGAQHGSLFFTDDPELVAADIDISALWDAEGGIPLTPDQEQAVDRVLDGRRHNIGLARRFYARTTFSDDDDSAARLLVLFTNVSWDSSVTGKSFAFPSMFDWVNETIRLVGEREDLRLVVRVHPGESRWPGLESRERVADHVAAAFPVLPPNVRIIPPEEPADSYALMDAADAVFVFASTTGLEAAAGGKAVCAAGKTHYRGRGFTADATDAADYAALINDPTWMGYDEHRHTLARRYAHLFFCRAMLPFPLVIEDEPSEPIYRYAAISDLAPGQDQTLDVICDGIIRGTPFRLPRGEAVETLTTSHGVTEP